MTAANRDALIDGYADHYRRINGTTTDIELTSQRREAFGLLYGDLLAELPPGSRVLDIGCGSGILLEWLAAQPGITAVGVDASSSQIELARRRLPDVEVVLADGLEYLRDHPSSFRAVFALDILEHIPGADGCIDWVRAIHDALVPGGFLYCRSPNAANVLAAYSRYIDLTHERIFTSKSMVQLLTTGGFSDVRIVPLQGATQGARLRMAAEHAAHRALFRLCGRGLEHVFTSNICGLARKSAAE